jgi:HTH-type transcriptional regulator/antitoxin HigA
MPLEGSMPLQTPAEAVRSAMDQLGWSQADLAFVLGVDRTAISQILAGRRGISPDLAKAFAVAFGVPLETFAKIQAEWELRNARDPSPGLAARAVAQTQYPIREMMKRGWIRENSDLQTQLCAFFSISSLVDAPRLTHAAKRTEQQAIPGSQLAWLFRVRQIAKEMPTPPYSRTRLENSVEKMKLMLGAPEEVRHAPRLLHEAGVRFVIVEGLPGSQIDGVCFWLDSNSPVIGMSLRFDRIDNFWFVLRHECSHVLHGHGQDEAILDAEMDRAPVGAVSNEETIANSDASEFCVPQSKMQSFYLRKNPFFAERDVLAFAKIMKVHPGLVVGQLQRIVGRYDLLRRHLVSIRNHISGSALVDGWGDVIPVGS